MLASMGAAVVGVSRVQRSRVRTVVGLLQDRTRLLDDFGTLEERVHVCCANGFTTLCCRT